jgi:hypothetical protein
VKARLLRFANSPFGCFGWLLLIDDLGGMEVFAVAEDDWLDNQKGISAIPVGTYRCKRVMSPRHGPTFEVTQVPNRNAIMFHAGNTEESTEGCLLLGEGFGSLRTGDEDAKGRPVIDKWAVKDSAKAYRRFRDATIGLQEFQLTIEWDLEGDWRNIVP